jgi:hypothetical protein
MKKEFKQNRKLNLEKPPKKNKSSSIILLSMGGIDEGGDDDGGFDDGGFDDGGFDEGQPVESEVDKSSYSTETDYVDDDLNLSDPNNANSAAYYAPIEYEYPVHITYITFPLAIIELEVGNVIVRPNSQTTIHPTKGTFLRVITPITTGRSGYFIGPLAYCSWSYQLNIRYTNITEGFSYTRQISGSHSAVISVP